MGGVLLGQNMAKTIKRLTPAGVKAAGVGLHADGGGLYLQVVLGKDQTLKKSWFYRYALNGHERRMGLGSLYGRRGPPVSLSEARDLADIAKRLCQQGRDPIAARDAVIDAAKAELKAEGVAESANKTFRQVFEMYFEPKAKSLSNAKHIWQWRSTIETYGAPFMDRPVAEIRPGEIVDALAPIWRQKPETAKRTLQRIRGVFASAIVLEFRTSANPTEGVEQVLGTQQHTVRHHRAMQYAEVPAFVVRLRERNSWPATRLAFEWLILTATRSGETRLARWQEIDEGVAEWRIPQEHMKAKRLHVVPLSSRCLEILQALKAVYPHDPDDLLFPSMKAGAPLSDMTLTKVLRDMGLGEQATVHGMRSAFRDWATEVARVREVVAEASLAHTIKNKTEKAYRRATYLDERKVLMQSWARFCGKPAPAVVPMAASSFLK
jgi:integrase